MKKEKTVKTHTRKTKSGKTVTVKQHTAKYEAAEDIVKEALKKKKGAGDEFVAHKKKVEPVKGAQSSYDDFGFTKDEFKEWYEGTGSAADKKVEKALRKAFGRKAYDELSDNAADNYRKGGASKFFEKNVWSHKEGPKEYYAKGQDVFDKYKKHKDSKGNVYYTDPKDKSKKRLSEDDVLKKEGFSKVGKKKPAESPATAKTKTPTAASLKKEGWVIVRPGAIRVGGYNQLYLVSPNGKKMYKLEGTRTGIGKGAEAVPTTKKVQSAWMREQAKADKMETSSQRKAARESAKKPSKPAAEASGTRTPDYAHLIEVNEQIIKSQRKERNKYKKGTIGWQKAQNRILEAQEENKKYKKRLK